MSKTARKVAIELIANMDVKFSVDVIENPRLTVARTAVETLDAAGFVIVPKLVRGETPGKVAAWQAFIRAMGTEMPQNPDGTYNGTFDHAVQAAIEAYIS